MVEETKKRYGETLEMAKKRCGDMVEGMVGEAETTKSEWEKVGKETVAWCDSINTSGEEFVTTTNEEKATCETFIKENKKWEKKNQTEGSNTVDDAIGKERERTVGLDSAVDEMMSLVGSQVGEMGAMLVSSVDGATKLLLNYSTSARNDVDSTKIFLESDMSTDAETTGKLIQASKEMDSLVSGHVLEVYAPTGMTPAKREYEFPSPAGKMEPRAVVLAAAKSSKQSEEATIDSAADSKQEASSPSSSESASESGSAPSLPMSVEADSADIELVEDDKKAVENKEVVQEEVVQEKVKKTRSRRPTKGTTKRASGIPRAKRALNKPLAEKN
jgi:hypothetical protein